MNYYWDDFVRYIEKKNLEKKRRPNNSNKKKKSPHVPFFNKTSAEILFYQEGEMITLPALVILHELTPIGVSLFTSSAFPRDFEVIVNIAVSEALIARAKVVSCKSITTNAGIQSQQRQFQYRVQLQFTVENKDEAKSVEDSCKLVKASPVTAQAA